MSKYKQILAAIDVTEEAPQVMSKAAEIAADNGAQLNILTVIRPLTHAYTGMEVAGLAAAALNFESEATASVKNSLSELCVEHNIDETHTYTAFGVPAAEIKAHAEKLGADLVIVGSHGRHGLGLLLGSTANAVLHGAECDVLTIRIREP